MTTTKEIFNLMCPNIECGLEKITIKSEDFELSKCPLCQAALLGKTELEDIVQNLIMKKVRINITLTHGTKTWITSIGRHTENRHMKKAELEITAMTTFSITMLVNPKDIANIKDNNSCKSDIIMI